MPRDVRLVVRSRATGKPVMDGLRHPRILRGRDDDAVLQFLGYDPEAYILHRGGQSAEIGPSIAEPYPSWDAQLAFRRPREGLDLSSEERFHRRRTALFHPLEGLGDAYDSAVVGAFVRTTVDPSYLALYVGRPEVISLARRFHFRDAPVFDHVLVWDEGSWSRGVGLEKPKWELFFDWRAYVGRIYYKSEELPVELGTVQEEAFKTTFSEATNALKDLDRTVHQLAAETMGITQVSLDEITAEVPADDEIRESVRRLLPDRFVTVSNGSDLGHGARVRQTKEWSAESWAQVVRELRETQDHDVVHVGRQGEDRIEGCISLVGETNVEELLWVLSRSRLHLSVENGTVRLARAVGTRSVVLFGPTSPSLYALEGNETVLTGVCEPCCWSTPEWTTSCSLDIDTLCMRSIPLDMVTGAVWRLLSASDIKRIAFLSCGGLGDDLVKLNVMRQLEPMLRERHPNCRIRYVCRQVYPFLQRSLPFVDEWMPVGMRKTAQELSAEVVADNDLTFDLRRSGQVLRKGKCWKGNPLGGICHAQHVTRTLASSLTEYSFEDDGELLTDHLRSVRASWSERRALRRLLSEGPYVVIANGTDSTFPQQLTKRVPPAVLRGIIQGLHQTGFQTVQVGTPEVYGIKEEGSVFLIGKTSIEGLIEVLRGARGVIACEGGTAHLAVHLRVPTVVLFGPTDPTYWGYDSALNLVAEACTCPLRPCEFMEPDWHLRCAAGRTDEHGHAECMISFSEELDEVIPKIADHFGARNA